MADLEPLAAYEIRTNLLAILGRIYPLWQRAETELNKRPSFHLKQTKAGQYYVYVAGQTSTPLASANDVREWTIRKQSRDTLLAQRKELKELERFYRFAHLPYIDADIGAVLRELDKVRLLGRSVYVIGALGAKAHALCEQGPVCKAAPTHQNLQLWVVSNEEAFLTSVNDPESYETPVKAIAARNRDDANLAGVLAQVEQVIKQVGISHVALYTTDMFAPLSADDAETMEAWGARQWADDDPALTVIALGTDSKPVPLVVPELALLDVLHKLIETDR